MNYQRIKKVGILIIGLALFTACGSTQENDTRQSQEQNKRESGRGNMPSVTDLLAQMDSNKDGKLSVNEVQGPLKNDFSKIDTNDDGFIDEDELSKAPKPQRNSSNGRPPRGN